MEIVGKEKSKFHYSVLQVFVLQLIISQLQISLEKVVLDPFTRYASMSLPKHYALDMECL